MHGQEKIVARHVLLFQDKSRGKQKGDNGHKKKTDSPQRKYKDKVNMIRKYFCRLKSYMKILKDIATYTIADYFPFHVYY